MNVTQNNGFNQLKTSLLNIDPVNFCENFLTLDGEPFKLTGNGYAPFASIYRYIGLKAIERHSKPVILVKGRQVGGTTMASALDLYFMCSGLFGGNNPPMRAMHAFPTLKHSIPYSKTKLSAMINTAKPSEGAVSRNGVKKSIIQSMLDTTSDSNNSLEFKQFIGGNHLWIESTGMDGDRLRGRTLDAVFFDECFPSNQCIMTENGKITIGKLFNKFKRNESLPKVLSFNEGTRTFEFKKILNAWKKDKRKLFQLICENRKIKCTGNHRFLTTSGWKQVKNITENDVIITSEPKLCQNSFALNDDQYQVILGSFLGDGHLSCQGKNKYRLQETHSIKQQNYARWKANLFNSDIINVKNNGFSKKPAVYFNTKTFILPNKLPKNKTYCPQWVLDDLNEIGLAIWFMDDGSKNKNGGGVLYTCSFDEDSQKRIVSKLKQFGIKSKYKKYLNHGSEYFQINIGTEGFKALSKLIAKYIHSDLNYKINNNSNISYIWNNKFKSYGLIYVKKVKETTEYKYVYDIEVEDNHNFIVTSGYNAKGNGGLVAHNCQDILDPALNNTLKCLSQAKYGPAGSGVQVFFGTPKAKGSSYHKMWKQSTMQLYYLGCENCKKHFPLYTPDSDEWEKIWIHTFIVKCTHCGHEQNKIDAAERGKWVMPEGIDPNNCKFIGFHINQLYIPNFSKEFILSQKPENDPTKSDRDFRNEVMGEFFQGDSSTISREEIIELCGDQGRKFKGRISPGEENMMLLGIDYGARSDAEQLANPDMAKSGKSYSTAVVLSAKGPKLLNIEYAIKFQRNDFESKKGIIEQLMRQYSIDLTIGDIGFSHDFSGVMHTAHGDKYLVSRAMSSSVNKNINFRNDITPKEIQFNKNYFIEEAFDMMRAGAIRFPLGDFEKCAWLIDHCASMDIKVSLSKTGEHKINYVKGNKPNDGFMALLNAYIGYKFMLTKGFTIQNPYVQEQNFNSKDKPLIIGGYMKF